MNARISKWIFCFLACATANAVAASSLDPVAAPNGNGGGFSGPDLTGSSVGQPIEQGPTRDEIQRLTSDCAHATLARFWERIYRRPFIAAPTDVFDLKYEVGNCDARVWLSSVNGPPGNFVEISYSKCEPGPAEIYYSDRGNLVPMISARAMPFYADDGSLHIGEDSTAGPDIPAALNIREFAQCLRQSL